MSFSEIYTMGAQRHVKIVTTPSEATGHGIENAFDHDLDSYWKPTSTADQTIDLDMGQPKDMIADPVDRAFSPGTGWVNVDFTTFNQSGDLSVTSSSTWQSCNLPSDQMTYDWHPGKTYQIRYDANIVSGSFTWRMDNTVLIGVVSNGARQTLTFTPAEMGNGLFLIASAVPGEVHIDNVSIVVVDDIYKVDAFGFWLHNHRTEHALTVDPSVVIQIGDVSGAGGEDFHNQSWGGLNLHGHLLLTDDRTEAMRRYWRIQLKFMLTVVEISHFFFLRKFTIAQQNVYPERTERTFYNRTSRAVPGGRRSVNVGTFRDFRIFERTFKFFGDTTYDMFEDQFRASAGGALPMIVKEGDEYILVRLLNEVFKPTIVDAGVRTLKLTFAEIPYRDEDSGY